MAGYRYRRMKNLAAAAVVILFASSLSFALPACSNYSFFGTIIVAARDYPMKYEVQLLTNRGDEVIARTYVDMTNRFVFDGVPTGRFDVVVRLERFQELRAPIDVASAMSAQANGGCNVRNIFWLLPLERPNETSS